MILLRNKAHLVLLSALLCLAVMSCRTDFRSSAPVVYKDKAFTEFFRRHNGWTAGDGATSVPLSDGRVIWLFGDSHVNDFHRLTGTLPCLFQVRNAGFIHDKRNLRHSGTKLLNEPSDKNLFRLAEPGKSWFWPQAGFQNSNTVYIFLTALEPRGVPGNWDFKGIGHYWAKMEFPDLKSISYVELPEFNRIDFGCGFVKDDASDYTFAFGQKGNSTRNGTAIYLARFKTAEPAHNWTFWDGNNWSENATNALPIADCASVSVSACKVKNRFLLTSSALSVRCDMGREIFVSTSDKPTGPFSPIKKIFTLDDTLNGHYPFFYIPVAHPEFLNDKDELLFTYSINGYEPCVPICVKGRMNPDHYRPRAIRVPLKWIDSSF